jgi:hypothetical protein
VQAKDILNFLELNDEGRPRNTRNINAEKNASLNGPNTMTETVLTGQKIHNRFGNSNGLDKKNTQVIDSERANLISQYG